MGFRDAQTWHADYGQDGLRKRQFVGRMDRQLFRSCQKADRTVRDDRLSTLRPGRR